MQSIALTLNSHDQQETTSGYTLWPFYSAVLTHVYVAENTSNLFATVCVLYTQSARDDWLGKEEISNMTERIIRIPKSVATGQSISPIHCAHVTNCILKFFSFRFRLDTHADDNASRCM